MKKILNQYGQFESAQGGQFKSASGGQLKSARGGQFDRRLHKISLCKCNFTLASSWTSSFDIPCICAPVNTESRRYSPV